MTPSWYDVLDVEPTATAEEIRAAWRTGIAELEPGSRRFQTLNQAAEVLLDERKRAAYDAELAAQAPEPVAEESRPGVDLTKTATETIAVHEVPSRGVPTWLLAVLGVLAAVSVGAAIWVWQAGDDTAVEEATSGAQAAAELAIEPLLSYNYQSLEADQKRAESYLTADYREDYDKLFALIEDNAQSVQPQVEANAFASAIVRSGEERVDVLLFVDQLTTNKGMAQPVTYKNQVTVTMQKVGEDWLIDNLVTSPAAQ
ncbi:MAG: J domain-containing protein [Nocardioides sp.]|uniref:J domain-containing protein n=1 Tax=Nocardioides sp. TaxID=35761 RepID=UPI0032674BDE